MCGSAAGGRDEQSHTHAWLPPRGRRGAGQCVRVCARVPRSSGARGRRAGRGGCAKKWAPGFAGGTRSPGKPVFTHVRCLPGESALCAHWARRGGLSLRGGPCVLPHGGSRDTCGQGCGAYSCPGIAGVVHDQQLWSWMQQLGTGVGVRRRVAEQDWGLEGRGSGSESALCPSLTLTPRASVSCLWHESVARAPSQAFI